jgi:hypothetical protein
MAKGYSARLSGHEAVKRYLGQHRPEMLEEFQALVDTEALDAKALEAMREEGEQANDDDEGDDLSDVAVAA